MAANYREVCMEVYFNGEFYCGDSYWVPDGEDVELEFQITGAIYDLIGTDPSAQIHLELQTDTDDPFSVSYCALEGNVVKLVADEINTTSVCECGAKEKQLETDVKNVVSELVSRVCEGLTDPAGPSTEVEESSSAVDASLEAPEICPTESTNGWMNTIGTFFKRLFWRDPAVPEPVCVTDASTPEPTSELDLVDTAQSSVPFPSVPEAEPESEQSTVPGPSSSEPEPELDLADPEESCDPVPRVPEPEPELEHPAVPDPSSSEPEPELDLVDPEESCDPVPSIPEPEPEPEQSTVPGPSSPEPEPELDLVDPEESCDPVPSVPEPEPEPEQSTVPGPSSSEPEPELDLADPEESCDPVPRAPEPETELDLVDPESSVPGPSISEPLDQEVDADDAILDLKSPTLVSEELKMDASPETPKEKSPKRSNKVKKKFCAFFKKLFGKDPTFPEPLCVPDAGTLEPEPEMDLDAIEQSCVPAPSIPELEPDLDPFDSDESCDLVPFVYELETALYLVDSDESCVPGPSSAVPRPKASTSKKDPCFQLEERVKACTMHYKPVTKVWNNIFIGNEETARDRMRMKELGITHILNAAAVKKKLRILLGMPWKDDLRDTVNTGASYYRGMRNYRGRKIRYCGLPTTKSSNISKYFLPAAKFIHKAKKNPENKVFIHCTDGVSYAPTLFLAYLMIHQNMTVEDAIDYLVKVKYIKPDIDFLRQLAILNEELVHK